ncbi:hypothetical protein TMatcc_001714 [Talaromyces marneffei ATCC 18224]
MIILQGPIFVIESLGGFFPSSCSLFVFFGFVQYLSKMPSLSHFFLDRSRDMLKIALKKKEINRLRDSSFGCRFSTFARREFALLRHGRRSPLFSLIETVWYTNWTTWVSRFDDIDRLTLRMERV